MNKKINLCDAFSLLLFSPTHDPSTTDGWIKPETFYKQTMHAMTSKAGDHHGGGRGEGEAESKKSSRVDWQKENCATETFTLPSYQASL